MNELCKRDPFRKSGSPKVSKFGGGGFAKYFADDADHSIHIIAKDEASMYHCLLQTQCQQMKSYR